MKIAILAGNPLFENSGENPQVLDAQLSAFTVGLLLAQSTREEVHCAIAPDHRGNFRKQYTDSAQDLSGEEKLHMGLLDPRIRNVYAAVAEKYGVPLEQIDVIPENASRERASQAIPPERREACKPSPQSPHGVTPNCSAITSSIIAELAKNADEVWAVWENARPSVIHRGIMFAYSLRDIRATTRNHMLEISGGNAFLQQADYHYNESSPGKVDVSMFRAPRQVSIP